MAFPNDRDDMAEGAPKPKKATPKRGKKKAAKKVGKKAAKKGKKGHK